MPKKYYKLLFILVVVSLIGGFFLADLQRFITLEALQAQKEQLLLWFNENRVLFTVAYTLAYTLMAALSLPGATIFTLAAGAIFGMVLGSALVSIASTVGATLAFLSARYLLAESVQRKFGEKLKSVNEGLEKEGGFYLFSLRVIPLFPFFLVNLLMGLTSIPARTFFWVSQVGMIPGTLVYVYAGTQLKEIKSVRDIMSPGLLLAFALIGIFPVISKKLLDAWKARSSSLGKK